MKLEQIPGEDKEKLEIADVEQLKDLDQATVEQEISDLKEQIGTKHPDLVRDEG